MAYKPLQNEGAPVDDDEEEVSPLDEVASLNAGGKEDLAALLPNPPGGPSPLPEKHGPDEVPNKKKKVSPGGVNVDLKQPPSKWYKVFRYILGTGVFVLLFAFLAAAIALVILSPACRSVPDDGQVWWKTTVIYQCYPRSFKDSTGNGSGDLNGIRDKLDYFHDLGVEAVWLNPIFTSPQRDNGYDVANYTDVDPLFGTLDDLRSLLKKLHSKNMRLILDLVPNHTSEKHPWFVDSRSSRDSSQRDWYVWANASADGGPPNNWLSLFGGSAWSWDEHTGQYYLHQFSEFQPDLNYHNLEVRKAMEEVIEFWFGFGVDGFRIDAVIFLLEDPDLMDEPPNPDFNDTFNCTTTKNANAACYDSLIHNKTKDYSGIHNVIRSWRKIADSYPERFFVGETYDPVETVMSYYGKDNDEFHFPFNFLLLSNQNWTGDGVSDLVSQWMDAMPEGAWPNWVLGNHDNPRIASKAGLHLARALNVLLLTLPGTPTTYYGEEILMTDVYVPPDRQRDKYQGRDQERTPMQWDSGPNAGFTDKGVEPWLPLPQNYTTYNVKTEKGNSSSMLRLYERLVKLRTTQEAFRFAEYAELYSDEDVFAYHRFHNGTKDEYVVVINFSSSNTTANLTSTDLDFQSPKLELSSHDLKREGSKVDLDKVYLSGGEAVIISGHSEVYEDEDNDC